MREHELAELFRDAADSAPEATFDAGDIAKASRRVTARRRVGAAGGSLLALAVVAGGVGFGTGWIDPRSSHRSDTASTGVSERTSEPAPRVGTGQQEPTVLSAPGDRSAGCGPPDPELADALSEQLPAVSDASAPVAAQRCPPGARTASFQLRTERSNGNVTVILGSASSAPSEGSVEPRRRGDDGVQVAVRTGSGRELILRSSSDSSGPPPYEGELTGMARRLAGEL
ncbi:hypothetical protein SAMN04487820_102454 [Actinopolyspora mzabensis]|uniref:Uncharacterized protein n=1 Tax=Actinopolyspora mzabensis TaxID=995066 RepID=A0A1G8X8M7_ACTMZ|nr:hypothetical protein [Actinopolyspora mzabensis]SDJ87049.1 hypothetical protein SAMN04487820_102454 [Actinopolyspora mzabensis]